MRKTSQRNLFRQISRLREQLKDLNDYLDLLEARARNKGKRTFTKNQVCRQIGL